MFTIACILLVSLCVVESSSVSRCNVTVTFNFVEDETPNITCSGFPVGYWSLSGPSTGGQEIRIGDCSRCGSGRACSCVTNSTDYTITRNGDYSTLHCVNNLLAKNRSIIRCSTENNATCVASSINILKAPVRCRHASNCIEIVEDQPTPLTCQLKGAPGKEIYWSVTRPSTPETAIGNCSKCATKTHLPCTCHTHNEDYNITRTGDTSTAVSILQFVNNVLANDNSTIKCSTSDNKSELVFVIDVIPAYRLTECSNNNIFVYENSERRIRCEGMERSQSMYWSITYPNNTEQTVAECGNCENETCQCDVKIEDFSVEISQTVSVLRMTAGNDRDKEGAAVKCSKSNNATHDQCQLRIRYYALQQCTEGRVYLSETEPHTHITCDGVDSSHSMNWTLTADSGLVTVIAECYGNGTCTKHIDDVTVSKNESASTLTFVQNVRQGDNQTLNCVRRNGETSASCRIRTFYDDPEPFPWVVVGAAVGAAVLVIIVVIAIVVVVYRRRAHRKGAVKNNAGDNATDDDFEEHTNDLYQSSDLDTPFHLQPLQVSTTPQVSDTVNADTNGIQEMTQTAQPTNGVYNVLGSTPHGDQKAGAVYNHLTKC